MYFMNWIINELNDVSDWFYELYLDCYYAGWPLSSIASWFRYLYQTFNELAWDFSDFFSWLLDMADQIEEALSWSTIKSNIISWFRYLGDLSDIFYYFGNNVASVVTSWWSATQWTVRGWIDAAVSGFNSMLTAWSNFWNNLWPQMTSSFNSLKSAWENFTWYTLPRLPSWGDIEDWWSGRVGDLQGLINSAFTDRASLWEGWQELRDNVVEFFTDPVEFIWDRFADWFLGPEV